MNTLELYVKACDNCPAGFPLTSYEVLSPTWSGDAVEVLFGLYEQGQAVALTIIGLTDLIGNPLSPVCVVRVADAGREKYLIYGGNWGIRVLPYGVTYDHVIHHWTGAGRIPGGEGLPALLLDMRFCLPSSVQDVVRENLPGEEA